MYQQRSIILEFGVAREDLSGANDKSSRRSSPNCFVLGIGGFHESVGVEHEKVAGLQFDRTCFVVGRWQEPEHRAAYVKPQADRPIGPRENRR